MIATARNTERDVVLASADPALRQRLRESLAGLRWRVHEAAGGAEALTLLESQPSDALLMDGWLPDLEASELAGHIATMYPAVDVLSVDGGALTTTRSAHRHELLHALREAQQTSTPQTSALQTSTRKTDTAAWNTAPATIPGSAAGKAGKWTSFSLPLPADVLLDAPPQRMAAAAAPAPASAPRTLAIPGLIGDGPAMRELTQLIRLVAPRNAAVLIEGETGTGKEVVASAIHRLSGRASKPLTVLNCAAIPEALLEAELFGHTRGAFTGAVQSRTGRIEAAHGGTLFLDEIGELPLPLQAKLLRFLECGEIQRVGDNEVTRVDVRVIAATHRDLEQQVVDGAFRLDLYHRLAVFPIEVPALRERLEDLPALAEHLLARLGADAPRKSISADALHALEQHNWPGNVRELAHVLERAVILAADSPEIAAEHIRCRRRVRG
ncbi:MAG TPA: sigma-54 dependent transcriptional regulator [Acidobacteriaceae bacterium]|nr:sigma-54 dependent transcriptional regulator [Acidobacteriaceae bacterium]